jgi:hypothetical protein
MTAEQQGHTPGPWELDDENQICAGNKVIARAVASGMPDLEWDANARLIAAAPAMLAALKFYADNWFANAEGDPETPGLLHSWQEPTDELWADEGRLARAAIAKATGGQS